MWWAGGRARVRLAAMASRGQSRGTFPGTLDQHPAIDYRGGALSDVVTGLRRDLRRRHDVAGVRRDRKGYLLSLLGQAERSGRVASPAVLEDRHPATRSPAPENPRALYFNDRVVVGYIPGAPVIEMASHDPRQGVIFQTLKQDAWLPGEFARPDRCLGCHLSANSLDVPGILVRSMFAGGDGRPCRRLGSFVIDHRSPLEQRWGGWYVPVRTAPRATWAMRLSSTVQAGVGDHRRDAQSLRARSRRRRGRVSNRLE